MKILHISDTHVGMWQLYGLPHADVIVHSGDFTMNGTADEMRAFVEWFSALPYRYKLFVAGNHDKCLYGITLPELPAGCHYLCYDAIDIDGIRFYGLPMFKADIQSGVQRERIMAISADTDVIVSHQPPYGILDFSDNIHYGSHDLLKRICKIKLSLHLFGHIHNEHGTLQSQGTTFSNAALLNNDYQMEGEPAMFEL